ncbi:hypothetical protein LAV84_06840 [Rhizobium sp. VS19-DR104.2]|uniref:hypothetical protein n=1 Tax=unclassified Rhizobium TaxID=2613769 RepID=UPI001CC6EAAC|nr:MULTISPECIES: hypothetical protein [unclassified Rhizobium]MBZ5760263.1 hypothetical protein [Rhizobium sp. VS19-DR96]MBZ5766893.1 hypothetical protein [Rhizobium sp. VS19-DR129.2]MBZ5773114.1 hypothetical protein [Rhizobium sp. VS19-DRK62.2]MBZ5784098.1 hypothetical protein [Rhizobium sp. VS19-DR121]MBZ5802458.1 hypothetical protein [Rhizobium sp. VS19-DR181]
MENLAIRPLRILVGCETSGRVRRAFAALGHDAWSCDLLPSDDIAAAMADQWGGYALEQVAV